MTTEPASRPAPQRGHLNVNVGGVTATREQVTEAIDLLEADGSTQVKLPLSRKDNPLSQVDYHGISDAYYDTHPKLPKGTTKEHVGHVKAAVLYHLKQQLGSPCLSPLEQAVAAAEEEAQREAGAEPPPANNYDARNRVIRRAVARRGQPKFRSKLIKAYSGRCAVTGYEAQAALEAAHLRPYRGPGSNTLSNGLLLRADIHTLLDLGLLALNPQTRKVAVSRLLAGTQYESLSGVRLAEPVLESQRPSQDALDTLWQYFTQAESDRMTAGELE